MAYMMSEEEFRQNIYDKLAFNKKQPERMNARLGLELLDCSFADKWIELGFDVKEWAKNPYGGVHGGVICTIFDTGMGTGAVALSGKFVTTTDLSVSYLKPMNADRYIVHVDYTHVGRSMIRCTAKALDAYTGALCATGMASFMLLEGKTAGLQD